MRVDIIQTKLTEMEESLRLISENLPDKYQNFSNLGIVKHGIY